MPVLPEYSLSGKVAMLATAGGDQAAHLAQALDEAGASVFAVARRRELLDQVLEALDSARPHGGVVADAATPAGMTQVMEAFDRQHNQQQGAAGGVAQRDAFRSRQAISQKMKQIKDQARMHLQVNCSKACSPDQWVGGMSSEDFFAYPKAASKRLGRTVDLYVLTEKSARILNHLLLRHRLCPKHPQPTT